MQAKLTLRLDAELIEQAKGQARRHGKSVSQLVADYFARLDQPPPAQPPLPPMVASLRGALRGSAEPETPEKDYRAYLERKHR